MTDRNTISQVVESLFEDWIGKNQNLHPLAVENMRLLEADAITLLKEHDAVEPIKAPFPDASRSDGSYYYICGACSKPIDPNDKYCRECGTPVLWEGS